MTAVLRLLLAFAVPTILFTAVAYLSGGPSDRQAWSVTPLPLVYETSSDGTATAKTRTANRAFILELVGTSTPRRATPAADPFSPVLTRIAGSGVEDCDDNYDETCIPVVGYDLDCADVSDTDFVIDHDDPHGFDGDTDGIGCESS